MTLDFFINAMRDFMLAHPLLILYLLDAASMLLLVLRFDLHPAWALVPGIGVIIMLVATAQTRFHEQKSSPFPPVPSFLFLFPLLNFLVLILCVVSSGDLFPDGYFLNSISVGLVVAKLAFFRISLFFADVSDNASRSPLFGETWGIADAGAKEKDGEENPAVPSLFSPAPASLTLFSSPWFDSVAQELEDLVSECRKVGPPGVVECAMVERALAAARNRDAGELWSAFDAIPLRVLALAGMRKFGAVAQYVKAIYI